MVIMVTKSSALRGTCKKFKAHILMVMAQIGYTLLYFITEASFNHGMNPHFYITYRPIVAGFVMLPFAYFLGRDIMLEYLKEVMKLGFTLFEILSETLGLNPSHLNDMGCSEGLTILGHYYPSCLQPELTLGASKHADNDFLTLLLQDQIGGFQVLHQNCWVNVPPIPGALVLVSNDKFNSAEHRVLANKVGSRVSVASFFYTRVLPSPRVYGPIKEILSKEKRPKYRETTVKEYAEILQS